MDNLLNRIHFADCLDVLRSLPDGSVDLFLQDPPYNTTENEWEYDIDFAPLWAEWQRVGKENAAFVFTSAQPFTWHLIGSNRMLFKYQMIWVKSHSTGFLNAKKQPLRRHETIEVFYQKQPVFNPCIRPKPKQNIRPITVKPRLSTNYGSFKEGNTRTIAVDESYPDTILLFDNESKTETEHPNQKPIDLFRYLIRTYSNPGDVVFDGYGGSGTTAIAAQMEGRKFIVCENHLPYFEASQARLSNLVAAPYLFSDCG